MKYKIVFIYIYLYMLRKVFVVTVDDEVLDKNKRVLSLLALFKIKNGITYRVIPIFTTPIRTRS